MVKVQVFKFRLVGWEF